MRIEININTTNIEEKEAEFRKLNNLLANVNNRADILENDIVRALTNLSAADFFDASNTEDDKLIRMFDTFKDSWISIITERNVIHNISEQLNDFNKALTDEFVSDMESRISSCSIKIEDITENVNKFTDRIMLMLPSNRPDGFTYYRELLTEMIDRMKTISRKHTYSDDLTFVDIIEYVELVVDGYYNLTFVSSITHERARSLGLNEAQMNELHSNFTKAMNLTKEANEKLLEIQYY